jgi:hypothetical protein
MYLLYRHAQQEQHCMMADHMLSQLLLLLLLLPLLLRSLLLLLLLLAQVILNECHPGTVQQTFEYLTNTGALRWKGNASLSVIKGL